MLPFPVELHDDEILISYLSRLARKNGLPGVRDLAADFEIDWTGCLAGTEAALQQLASLTTVPLDRIAASAFRKTPDGQIALSGETLNDSRVMRGQFRVCPACLREDMGGQLDETAFLQMYARKLWALKAARVCPTHRLHLVPPPEPGVMHEFCSSWEPWLFELVEGELDRPTEGRGLFEAFAEARFSGTAPRLGWADRLPLCALGVASEVLGRTAGTLDDPEAAARDTDAGFGLLSAGEKAVVDEFDRRRVQQGQPQARPQGRYGPIHDWLKRGAGMAHEFDPLRDLLRTHIEDNWPLGPGDLLLDGVAEERRYHSVLSAAAQYDMRPARVRRLLDDAGLVATRTDLPLDEQLYPASDVDALLEPVGGSMSFDSVRRAVGLTRTQLESLIAGGILTPSRGGDAARPRLTRPDIDALCAQHARFPVARKYNLTGTIGIAHAARRHGVSSAEVYTRFLDGRVPNVMRSQNDLLWSSLVAPEADVDASFAPPGSEMDHLSISHASKRLFMTPRFLRELAAEGHFTLTDTQDPRTKQPKTVVSRIEVESFEERYVTRRALARHWRMQVLAVQKRLDARGIHPDFRSVDEREALFVRVVVEA